MTYLVFSQEPRGRPPFERLATNAARFFSSTLELLEESEASIVVRLACARPPLRGEFEIVSRDTVKDDLMNARDAEARGRAGGMAMLAEKCQQVWTIEGAGDEVPSEAAYLSLAGICASVALGPVLPPDAATLFGVRGAIERRDKALQGA
jgi:hypothetical protein